MSLSETERSYVNWIYHVPGIGRKKLKEIMAHGISPEELYRMDSVGWKTYLFEVCRFTYNQAVTVSDRIEKWKKVKSPEQLMDELYKNKISLLLPGDRYYPRGLGYIPDAPYLLYKKGIEDGLLSEGQRSVAIIGARECSQYGQNVARLLGKRCAEKGLAVVSGMAYGVDGIAQAAALAEGGMVAAVLGSGVDVCYPYSNRKLYEELCVKGCVYSEYVPKTEPRPTNFPPRNRIISGMADALIVVEAKEKSGTLITVDMALEQGKEVYVVPGRVSDPMSTGCNRLIRQGASVICDVDETLEEISGSESRKEEAVELEERRIQVRNPYPPGSLRHRIYQSMDMYPQSVQQIYESSVWSDAGADRPSVEELQTELFYMQMEGAVRESGGRFGAN